MHSGSKYFWPKHLWPKHFWQQLILVAPILVLMVAGILAPLSAVAGPASSDWIKTEQTALRLIAASQTTGDGDSVQLGLQFKLKPDWKIYWRSPGDAGFPPQPDWSGSANLKSITMQWPAPERFTVLGLQTLGYKEEVVFPLTITRKDPSAPLELAGAIRYLVCSEICIPYDAEVALYLEQGPAKPSKFAHLINRFSVKVPGDGGLHGLKIENAETWADGKDTFLRVRATATTPFTAPDLFPEGGPDISFSKPKVRLGPGRKTARLEMRVYGVSQLPGKTLAGKDLTLTLTDGKRAAEKRLPSTALSGPGAGGSLFANGGGGAASFALILLLAVLGGLILNLMPCVLPVLSIKLLGVVGHGGGERRIVRLSFIASALGILAAFMVLAGALVGLKSAGMGIGWGIQFQQPWFLIAMTLVVMGFACNLWGFFEFRLPGWVSNMGEHTGHLHGPGHNMGGHFIQGAFATLLATPCSAPFLGTAIGFALSRGPLEIFAVFTALGLGLALPYLTVAIFPGLATRLPRPGPWILTMKRILGFALAATAVWLLSVLSASIGLAAALAVGGLAVAGVGLAYWGKRALDGPGKRAPLWMALTFGAALMVPGWLGQTPAVEAAAKTTIEAKTLDGMWAAFDEAAIPGLIAAGKTVFVDVTADWCITCQVNKSLVLAQGAVLDVFRADNVVIMKADWTRPDPMIADFLARNGRFGIPFNAVYGPKLPTGIILPELLSERAVLDAFKNAG